MAFKRRLKFDKRIKHKKKMEVLYILLFAIFASLGIGYSYISTNLNINGTANVTAAKWDVHFTNLNVTEGSVTAETAANITSATTVEFAATLENPEDFYEFTVDAVNSGTMDAMIDNFGISPTLTTDQKKYLEYTVTYLDGTELVSKQALRQGTSEIIKVRFSYIENEDKTNYPTEDQNFTISFNVDYAQADDSMTEVNHVFANESWTTIINNIKTGRIPDYYNGATKDVDLGSLGTHTLRISNTTTPSECSNSGFSETACGVVLEFADIITKHRMNPWNSSITTTGNGSIGGWPASEMRTYVNSDIYNALPSELKSGIINTTVVSGHGSTSGETNFTSIDKLYLLSTHEVWEGDTGYDTAYNNTRQLDYYSSQNVTTSNYLGAIKQYNGSNAYWWLRPAYSIYNSSFYGVYDAGRWGYVNSIGTNGVSPAFRIG